MLSAPSRGRFVPDLEMPEPGAGDLRPAGSRDILPGTLCRRAVLSRRRDVMEQPAGVQIGKRAFFQSLIILFVLMLGAGVLTLTVPAGQYDRTLVELSLIHI